jgi:hypothetical protein
MTPQVAVTDGDDGDFERHDAAVLAVRSDVQRFTLQGLVGVTVVVPPMAPTYRARWRV